MSSNLRWLRLVQWPAILLAGALTSGCGESNADLEQNRCTFEKIGAAQVEGAYRSEGLDAPPSDYATAVLHSAEASDGTHRELWLEVWPGELGRVPERSTLQHVYSDCPLCVGLSEGCRADGTCAKEFYAVDGTVSIQEAVMQPSGSLRAVAEGLLLLEWDFSTDAPRAGGECRRVEQQTYDASWQQ
jgi:hypothetical protein